MYPYYYGSEGDIYFNFYDLPVSEQTFQASLSKEDLEKISSQETNSLISSLGNRLSFLLVVIGIIIFIKS